MPGAVECCAGHAVSVADCHPTQLCLAPLSGTTFEGEATAVFKARRTVFVGILIEFHGGNGVERAGGTDICRDRQSQCSRIDRGRIDEIASWTSAPSWCGHREVYSIAVEAAIEGLRAICEIIDDAESRTLTGGNRGGEVERVEAMRERERGQDCGDLSCRGEHGGDELLRASVSQIENDGRRERETNVGCLC